MAVPRASWTGQLRLSLVSLGIRLYPATSSSSKLALHQIHKPTGKRIRYEKTVPGVGPVKAEEIIKGFEYEKGQYVAIEPEEIEALRVEASRTIELTQFVDFDEIEPLYYDRPYYIGPENDMAVDAYVVLRDALRNTRKIGLGQVVISRKEHIVAVKPCGEGLLLETLRYPEEVRSARGVFDGMDDEADSHEEQIDLAEELIRRKSKPFEPKVFEDEYTNALRELIEAKAEKRKPRTGTAEGESGQDNVVDLMEALKRSVAGGASGKSSSAKGASGKSKSSGGTRTAKSGSRSTAKSSSGKSAGTSRKKKSA